MLSKRKKSDKALSVFNLVMINIIAIDSLRNLPTNAAAGLSIITLYVLAAIGFLLPCALVTAELATHYPKTGGAYIWAREAFGKRLAFVVIWLQWIYNVVWYPTILVFIATNIAYLIDPSLSNNTHYLVITAVAIFFLATVIASFGIESSSLLSTLSAIIGTLIPMLLIIGMGGVWLAHGLPTAVNLSFKNLIPSMSHNNNLALCSVLIFSLMGLEMSAIHAQDVKNPRSDYPRALRYSASLIVFTLILASVAIAIVVPGKSLSIYSGLDQAFALFLAALHIKWLLPIIIGMIILGSFGGMAAWVTGPTRALMIAAEDGSLPKILTRKNRHGAPIGTLILQLILVILLSGLFLLYPKIQTSYWILSDITAELALLFYIFFFAAAIKLRYTTHAIDAAYRIPGKNNRGMWSIALLGMIVCIAVMLLGLIPPASIALGNIHHYELILIGGTALLALIPLPIRYFSRK